ncbi:hypothetical protein ElyMa_005005900 [Elysia marginata]|uniref:Uncharacterized protein n=1 Tax=Elysia marginata TaxID=1093978 RepID=A0AAV4J8U6_9GAST|nr:hypothetical protein ElyMa_005005900 [Elysia marginata]
MVIGNGPMGKDQHIDISMSDFVMTVSPSSICLLSAVAGAASVPSDEEILVPELEDFSRLWKKQSLADCSFWFTNSVVDTGTNLDEASAAVALNAEVQLRGEQVCTRLVFLLSSSCKGCEHNLKRLDTNLNDDGGDAGGFSDSDYAGDCIDDDVDDDDGAGGDYAGDCNDDSAGGDYAGDCNDDDDTDDDGAGGDHAGDFIDDDDDDGAGGDCSDGHYVVDCIDDGSCGSCCIDDSDNFL